jgi:hypothetical protein
LPHALSPPSSIELGVVVDHIKAHLDIDRRELQDSITLDDFVGPTIARARVKIDKALVLLDDRVLPDRRRREIVEFLRPRSSRSVLGEITSIITTGSER